LPAGKTAGQLTALKKQGTMGIEKALPISGRPVQFWLVTNRYLVREWRLVTFLQQLSRLKARPAETPACNSPPLSGEASSPIRGRVNHPVSGAGLTAYRYRNALKALYHKPLAQSMGFFHARKQQRTKGLKTK
jgi:hypothetical protein